MNIARGKAICKLYKQGLTVSQVAKILGIDHSQVDSYLKVYYKKIYNEEYVPFAKKRAKFLGDLYDKYKKIYVQGAYSRTELCKLLQCKPNELEAMIQAYGLNNQWLKTYHGQVTLCNVSKEFRNDLVVKAKKYGYRSVRDLVVHALVEFSLYLDSKEEK